MSLSCNVHQILELSRVVFVADVAALEKGAGLHRSRDPGLCRQSLREDVLRLNDQRLQDTVLLSLEAMRKHRANSLRLWCRSSKIQVCDFCSPLPVLKLNYD